MIFDLIQEIQQKRLLHVNVKNVYALLLETEGTLCVKEIANRLNIASSEASLSISKLAQAGLVVTDHLERQKRFYKIDKAAVARKEAALQQFLENPQ